MTGQHILMDMKPVIARIAADCDLRNRFLQQFPKLLDSYFLSGSGELLTKQEADNLYPLNYFLDGLDLISGQLNLV
jgi:hypothetical protein